MKSRWPLKYDIRLIGELPVILIILGFIISIMNSMRNKVFYGVIINDKAYNISLFDILERKIPLVLIFIIIALFSKDTNEKSHNFIFSLPINRKYIVLVRYFRLLGIYTIFYSILFYIYFKKCDIYLSEFNIEKMSFLFEYINAYTTSIFLGSLTLFFIYTFKRKEYAITLCFGYWAYEFFSNGALSGYFQLFIRYNNIYEVEVLILNRLFYILLSLILLYLVNKTTKMKFWLA